MNRKELKKKAKMQIKGNVGILLLCTIIINLLCFGPTNYLNGVRFNLTFFNEISFNLTYFILFPPFTLGLGIMYLKLTNGKEINIGDVFEGFKLNFVKSIKLQLWMYLFFFLWTTLLIIPGIIKSYSYSMSYYILAENPEITAKEALQQSIKLMKGNKFKLFTLHISFIWWYLLCVITFGIAIIYVTPYINAAQANFYHTLVNKNKDSVDVNVEPIEVI